jgi:endoglucanase
LTVAGSTAIATTAIKLDQVGYLPNAPKLAVVSADSAVSRFTVVGDDGRAAFAGTAGPVLHDADTGDRVQWLDFSSVRSEGRYHLDVPGAGESWPFSIGRDIYRRAYYLTMRAFYGQRCGTAVDLGPEFPGYRHGACHARGAFHPTSGRSGDAPSHHGWHDAGDYGRYVTSTAFAAGTLLWAWELFGDRLERLPLHLPESGNGIPDILNEIRWALEWMLSMQDVDGGVWHKQTSERYVPYIAPDQDDSISCVIGTGAPPFKSTCATAAFAASIAIASRVLVPFDAAYAARLRAAAERAWTWTEAHPSVLFSNPPGVVTGEYRDRECHDDRLWAAAELWRTTRDSAYSRHFDAHYAKYLDHLRPVAPAMWANASPLGLWSYAIGRGPDGAARAAIGARIRAAADALAERTLRAPYRNSMTADDYYWGSNSIAAGYSMQLLLAHALHADSRYADAALENVHYLLGRNTFSRSWVTHLGANPVRHPHHRPSASDRLAEPWPGLLSGGPNHRKQDPSMARMPDLPPAKMYVDERDSFGTNEVDIAWNAPLVFVLAAFQRSA